LGEKGKDEIAQALFVGVSKVEIKISHRRISVLAHGFNILDHRGTDRGHQPSLTGANKNPQTKERFFQSQLQHKMLLVRVKLKRGGQGKRFPWIQSSEPVDFHS
jgi:hypothetical protein